MPEESPKPVPVPDEASAPFWAAAAQGRLEVQRCNDCALFQYPPDLICRHCQSSDLAFARVSGRGTLYSYCIYTRSFMAGYESPYALALVDLEDHPEARLMTNLVDTPLDSIAVGMPVEVTFERRGRWSVPQFRAVTAG